MGGGKHLSLNALDFDIREAPIVAPSLIRILKCAKFQEIKKGVDKRLFYIYG